MYAADNALTAALAGAAATRYSADTHAAASRYAANASQTASRYASQRTSEATKYAADKASERAAAQLHWDEVKYGNDKFGFNGSTENMLGRIFSMLLR